MLDRQAGPPRSTATTGSPLACDVPEAERPLVATLWGVPRLGRAAVRPADGTRITWWRGRWSVSPSGHEVSFREVG